MCELTRPLLGTCELPLVTVLIDCWFSGVQCGNSKFHTAPKDGDCLKGAVEHPRGRRTKFYLSRIPRQQSSSLHKDFPKLLKLSQSWGLADQELQKCQPHTLHLVTGGTSTSMAGPTKYFEWFFCLLARSQSTHKCLVTYDKEKIAKSAKNNPLRQLS